MDGGTPSRSSISRAPGGCSSRGTTPFDTSLHKKKIKYPSCSHRPGLGHPQAATPSSLVLDQQLRFPVLGR